MGGGGGCVEENIIAFIGIIGKQINPFIIP